MMNRFWRSTWKSSNSWYGNLLMGMSLGVIIPLFMDKTEEWYYNEIKGVPTELQKIRARIYESPEDALRSDEFDIEIEKSDEEHKAFYVEIEHLSEIYEFLRKCRYYPGQETLRDIEKIDRLVEKTHALVAERERIKKMYTLAREHCRFDAPVDKYKKIRDLLKDDDDFVAARKRAKEKNKFIEECRQPNQLHIRQMNDIMKKTKQLLIERERIEKLINKTEGVFHAHRSLIR